MPVLLNAQASHHPAQRHCSTAAADLALREAHYRQVGHRLWACGETARSRRRRSAWKQEGREEEEGVGPPSPSAQKAGGLV